MPQQPVLIKGQQLRGEGGTHYAVTRKLGEGQFAEVWEVRQCGAGTDLRYAVKVEKVADRKSVKNEAKVLQKLPGECAQAVKVFDTGYMGRNFFMVMELHGDSIFDVRKQRVNGRVDLPTVKAIGLSTLAAIESLHLVGYIHRDIKPANFVINPPNAAASKGTWVLIDFGLARKYLGEDGAHMAARADTSFRGSTTYASVHAHRNEDLSRRDDLWSWFYMLLELVEGCLLWRPEHGEADKEKVLQAKENCLQQPELLARGKLPDALLNIHSHIRGLGFLDTPDYAYLRTCLQQLPGEEVQLQLQHLIGQGQQAWDQNGSIQQQQHHWDLSPLVQQQQQQMLGQPPSPYVDGMSPLDNQGLLATGSKRPRVSSGGGDPEAQAKRLRPDGNAAARQSWPSRHGSSSSPCDADDNRGDSRQGSLGPQRCRSSVEPQAQPSAAAGKAQQPRGSGQQQQANGVAETPAGSQQQRLRSEQPGTKAAGAAAAAAAAGAGRVEAPGGGRGSEIADLLVAYDREAAGDSKAATQQVVAGLCALDPLQAVCAISMTLDKLVKQSDVSVMPAVSQLLLDLAAFATHGANEASKVAQHEQQQQVAGTSCGRQGS